MQRLGSIQLYLQAELSTFLPPQMHCRSPLLWVGDEPRLFVSVTMPFPLAQPVRAKVKIWPPHEARSWSSIASSREHLPCVRQTSWYFSTEKVEIDLLFRGRR
jgi:hypothetical protein